MTVIPKKVKDISGAKFNRLTVVRYLGLSECRNSLWECTCECGATANVTANRLRSGNTKSCGCLHKETLPSINRTHGLTVGGKKERLYTTWRNMIERCRNKNRPSYKYYGGKGISVCEEWSKDYQRFREWAYASGYDEFLTIDRVDVSSNYSPDNCRWVSIETNCKENKTSFRPVVCSDGRYFRMMADAARETGARIGHIHSVVNGKRNKAAGLGWRYATPEEQTSIQP